ncbi:dendritic arbor reduction protein 1 [Anopheles darlingi]|uniref:dendritic arbor reduction protein 1 n=1 Tax=Anopheles darlingi TaxID=43151 RepID=UPI00210059E8|nr:dendritic arbor reduction protein 1 [Anopheles darlingi]XP_049536996.1 dendritic arbor reduction protein 1 [Anopheles darlingi]XP_049537005.1 dendritic arbor reduction protein 1 [Anopheles darlingi]
MKQETAQDDVCKPRPNAMISAVESLIPAGGGRGGGYTPPHHHHHQHHQQHQHHQYHNHHNQQQQQQQQQQQPLHPFHHHHRHHPMALASASLLSQLPLAGAIPPLLATAPCYPHSSPIASASNNSSSSSTIGSNATVVSGSANEFARPFPKQRYEDTRMGISLASERRSKYTEVAPVSPSGDFKTRATPLPSGQPPPGPVNLALGVGTAAMDLANGGGGGGGGGNRPGSNGANMLGTDTQWSPRQIGMSGIEQYKNYPLTSSDTVGVGEGEGGGGTANLANLHHPKALTAVQHHIQQRQHQQHQQLQQQQQLLRNDYVERSLKAQQKQQHLYHGDAIDGDLAKLSYPASTAGDGRQLQFFNPPALDVPVGGYPGLNYGLYPYRGILGRPVYTASQRINEQQYGTVPSTTSSYRAPTACSTSTYGSSTANEGAGGVALVATLGPLPPALSSGTDREHKSFTEPPHQPAITSTSNTSSSTEEPFNSFNHHHHHQQQYHQHHRQQPARYHPARYTEHGEEQQPSPGVPVSSPNDPNQKTHFSYQHPRPLEQGASVSFGATRYDSTTATVFPRDEVDEQLIDEYRRALHQLKHQQQVQQQVQQQQQQQQEFKVPCGGKDVPVKSRFLHQRINGSGKLRQPTHSITSRNNSISAIEEVSAGNAVGSNQPCNGGSNSGTTVMGEATFNKGSLIEFGSGESKRIEDVRAEDLIRTAEQSSELRLTEAIVRAITISDSAHPADPAGDALHMILVTFSYDRERYISKLEASFEYPFFVPTKGWASYSPSETLTKYNLHCKPLLVGDTFFALVSFKSQRSSSQQSTSADGTMLAVELGAIARKHAKKRSGTTVTGAPLRLITPTSAAAVGSRSCDTSQLSQQPEGKPLPLADCTYLERDRQQHVQFEHPADEGGGVGGATGGCCDDEDDRNHQQQAKKRSSKPTPYEDVSRRKRKPQRLSLSESSGSSTAAGN